MYKEHEETERVMKEAILSYIAACEENIASYATIEDKEERERAIAAAEGMKANFEKVLASL